MLRDAWIPSDSSDRSDPSYGGGASLSEDFRYVPIRQKPPVTVDPVVEIILPSIEVNLYSGSQSPLCHTGSRSSLSSHAESSDQGE